MILDPTQQYEFPADQAEVRIKALMKDGKTGMPAVLIATTNGELFALCEPDTNMGLFGLTMRPVRMAPVM